MQRRILYVQIQGRVVRFDAENGGGPEDRVSVLIRPLSVSGMGR